jgi:hypothetical protein
MQNDLIEKYLNNKHKALLSYASVLYRVYPSVGDSLWKSEEEYHGIISNVLNTYIKKYYLRDADELNSFNQNGYSEGEFKLAYILAIVADTFKDEYENLKTEYKRGLYILTVILYIIINVDKDVNIYTESVTTNSILTKLEGYFRTIYQEKIYENYPFLLENLANRVKDNLKIEKKFFSLIQSKDMYNKFSKYSDDEYFVRFCFNNPELEKYKEVDVNSVYKKFNIDNIYAGISYELVSVTILKEFLSGDNVHTFLLPIKSKFLKEEDNIILLSRVFNNYFIRNKVKFCVFYSDYIKNQFIFNLLLNMKFNVVIFMDDDEVVFEFAKSKISFDIYASNKFVDNNPKFMEYVDNNNLNFTIISRNAFVLEDKLIKEDHDEK